MWRTTEAAGGEESKLPNEMHTRLVVAGVVRKSNIDYDEIWSFYLG